MSIRKLVVEKIERLRTMITIWDDPAASQEEKGKVLASILGDEPKFWAEVAKRATAPKRNKKIVAKTVETVQVKPESAAVTKVVVAPKTSVSTAARPTPAQPVPATGPARTLDARPKKKNAAVSDFALKLGGAAEEVGLEDHTPLAKLRTLLKTDGHGGGYWKELRELLEVCLQEKLIQDVSDWKLLVGKMKEEPFVSGKKGEAFLAQCPQKGVEDLLLADDGLWRIVEALRTDGEINNNTPFHIGFMLDACLIVGKEAKELLIDCKQAVNHMKQTGFIARDHWLVQKVAAMKAPVLCSTPVSVTSAEPPSEAATDHKLEILQQVAEATAAEVPAEKPETLGPVADAQFEAAMMAAAGEVVPDMATMSDAELEKLTAPTLAVN